MTITPSTRALRPALTAFTVVVLSLSTIAGCGEQQRTVTATPTASKTSPATKTPAPTKRADAPKTAKVTPPKGVRTKPPAAPAEGEPDARARVVFVTDNGDLSVAVEVQRTPKELQRGLMFREHLPKGTGMLFLMPRQRKQTFWMRNTLIPLDMIFVDDTRRIVGIVANTTPLDETPRGVDRPSRFVIEVPGGYCQEVGIATGDRVKFLDVDGLD